MKAVMIAFDFRGHTRPVGFKEIKCHLIFDIKMDFTHKARFVAGGHMATPDPNVPIYASVVTRESVRILLTVASLNNLALKAADISNAFLTAKCDERICFRAGPEFGDKQGQWVVVVRALYGLVSASASFARHRNNVLSNMGFTPCQADPDVWMRRNLRKSAIAREGRLFMINFRETARPFKFYFLASSYKLFFFQRAHSQSWQLRPIGTLFISFLGLLPQDIPIFPSISGAHKSCSYFPQPKTLLQISLKPASSSNGNISA
mmetsp:Transcript_10659/g.17706  ORF Transcript_10659/g.17706 Transcript_10659/m.17706 type:complete len:262 (-) Transcript_10659:837-1622(-)